jgi:hypothetical protein
MVPSLLVGEGAPKGRERGKGGSFEPAFPQTAIFRGFITNEEAYKFLGDRYNFLVWTSILTAE